MRKVSLLLAFLTLGASVAGCFGFGEVNDCNYNIGLRCYWAGGGGDGGGGGTTTSTTINPECIPSNMGGAVDDSCGVFVSTSKGKDTNEGTKAAPFGTLGKALQAAKGNAVYACAETFAEAIALGDDATFYGGLDCANGWVLAGSAKTTWTANADEVPVRVATGARITVQGFVIEAVDAIAAGGSSIAVLAEAGTQVKLDQCEVRSGKGASGAAGELPMGTGTPGAKGSDGTGMCMSDAGEFGGSGGQLTCDAANVAGGGGGNGTKDSTGGDGSAGKPSGATGLGGKGQDVGVTCATSGDGMQGSPGMVGDPGAGAPMSLGTLGPSGYTGAPGSEGKPGTAAQGGGGGGGGNVCVNGKAGPSGGGGGSGGCGGAGGKAGGGGGGSFGLVSLGSKLTLGTVTITVSDGGKGGEGGLGQPGGPGGLGGQPGMSEGAGKATACTGGKGGDGGAGGKGGGGRGGPSFGIAYTGEAPKVESVTFMLGAPGEGGAGDGATGAGAKGVAAETQAFF